MYQSRSMSRMFRVLLSGTAAIAVCAQAAVPGTSPYGTSAPADLERTKPLSGGEWQLLSDRRSPGQATQGKALATAPLVAQAGAQAARLPAAQESPATGTAPLAVATVAVANPVSGGPRDWVVSTGDVNYRLLIEKWARDAGWTAAPWELDQDVEIGGTDSFNGDFKAAVRRVLSATEMTDYSLKPCFYSNNYVRVVKLTTKCDPSK